MIIDILIISLNSGIVDLIFASGKIYLYQITVNILIAISVLAGFVAVKSGFGGESLFYCYMFFSAIIFFVRPIIMLRVVKFRVSSLIKDSYIPVFIVSLLTAPVFILRNHLNAWLLIIIAMLWYMIIVWIIGLNSMEKNKIISYINGKVYKKIM